MTTQIVFGIAGDASNGNGIIPVMRSDGIVSQTISASGTNTISSITAPALGQTPICLIATDVAIYFAVGGNSPDAGVTSSRFFLPAGLSIAVACDVGDKAAVITA